MNNFSCIIAAGGSGTRFDKNKKKQYYELNGKPILNNTIDLFYTHDEINEIIIALPQEDITFIAKMLESEYPHKIKTIIGGKTRKESIYNALLSCDISNHFVIIHDAVRPFFDQNDLWEMMKIVQNTNAVIPGTKVTNTIKSVKDSKIVKTIPRHDLVEIYTPKIFSLDLILEAHKKVADSEFDFTDDSSILEHLGTPVTFYELKTKNIKITTKNDINHFLG